MARKRQRYSRELKLSILREYELGKSLGDLSREHEVHPSLISRWKKEYQKNPEDAFKGNGNILDMVQERG